jgi:hypothetical protein
LNFRENSKTKKLKFSWTGTVAQKIVFDRGFETKRLRSSAIGHIFYPHVTKLILKMNRQLQSNPATPSHIFSKQPKSLSKVMKLHA